MSFPLRVAAIYATFSVLWITLSDQLVETVFPNSITTIQTYKGWGFVFFSSLLILVLLSRELQRRNRAEARLQASSRQLTKLSQAVSQSPVAIFITDLAGTIEYVNDAFIRTTGLVREEAIGAKPELFRSAKNAGNLISDIENTLMQGGSWEGELINQRKDKTAYWVQSGISPVRSDEGKITHFLHIEEDISLRKAQANRIKHQANYDSLTELPNRFLAMDRMSQAINVAIRHQQSVVVMFVDLDNFKQINDSLGHEVGDQLITLAASRIRETVRQTDTVARYSGDEFLIVLTDLANSDDASRVAEKVLSMLAAPYRIDGRELSLTASIGIALFPEDGQDPYELLRHADAAMFGAKDEGGNRYEYYSAEVNQAATERMEIEQRLRRALENDELYLEYQPLIDLNSGKVCTVEALLRWNNPTLGQIPPSRFIPLAEATGLILPIGDWVIREALTQLSQWEQQGLNDFKLSVNISPRQFSNPTLSRTIAEQLQSHEISGDRLELEVTENLLMRNQQETKKTLNQLRELGISLALDDFGTGYSSLSYLKSFPFDTLKIDRCFIKDLLEHPQDQALVNATLTLADGLGLNTVGEGVETAEQRDYLLQHGLKVAQGYLYSRPLSPEQLENFLRQTTSG
ncbi:EAL domain-containing protein [Motiliproteus coralliicola]|uniref:cyclic-guanylate-specific phosphodiesterase n=1 Tax=Motiliproteus coralliicola TaxID=2283196 RepID=A0A369WSM2_9GAMM|nr:EAL domain-containing protein [Motiliproteus coralliicola]RDE22475.1 EAL domain-containing protein [Motiliproteus coralliicola]